MGDITPRQLLNLFQVVGAITNSDQILLHSAEGNTTTKITAELFRAYLNKGFEISVSDDGFLMIGGSKTQSKDGSLSNVHFRNSFEWPAIRVLYHDVSLQ